MKILRYEEISSTNILAKTLAEENAAEWTVVVAERQLQGQGRLNRIWESATGGLWFSVVLRPKIEAEFAPQATLVASLAVVKALRELYATEAIKIKWPNDLLFGTKKICGILSEAQLTVQGEIDYLVIGIGVNVGQQEFPENIQKLATSLFLATGIQYSCALVLDKILQCFTEYYTEWQANGYKNIRTAWLECNCTLGKFVTVKDDEQVLFEGLATQMDDYGSLLVTKADGAQEKFEFGEISIRECEI